ncbi:GTP-binding protein [Candidatus Woesearchaeota archaeon CG10_big_fil_rev_8_21_14_0_10_32_9]|nr:MAG: GTP-binding protein [Candidatus Woesearchaeota archaeon CG10_big_fil_rev_8_21_14_0_10_32_9]
MAVHDEKIKELEELVANSQYNKRTQKAIGMYKAQLAKLKEKVSKSGGGKTDGFSVRKTGDGTVVLLGFPSVGKSTLLNGITDAESETGAYAFTTLTVIPGILDYKHAKIQILDVPGVVRGAASGRGRGTEVFSVLRSADLILILIDVHYPEHFNALLREIYESGIRINKRKPDVKIKKTAKDGIKISKTVKLSTLDDETILGVLRTFRINNADVLIRTDITVDELIDCIEGNKQYVPAIVVLNKIDSLPKDKVEKIAKQIDANLLISAKNKDHLEELKELIFSELDLIRIYMKEPAKPADMNVPLIMFKDCTIDNVCSKLHKDFVSKFKFSRVWGKSAKFPGQKLNLKHRLKDEDILEIHLR